MVFCPPEYTVGVNGIKDTEIRVIAAEGDTGIGATSSLGLDVENRLLGDGRSHRPNLIWETQPDSDLARSVLERAMRYVEESYPSWPNEIARCALRLVPMSLTKDITAHDLAHFPHLSPGRVYPMSHSGHAFLYENGAFRLSNGAMPVSVIRRCKAYASYVGGSLWCVGERRESRNDVDIS